MGDTIIAGSNEFKRGMWVFGVAKLVTLSVNCCLCTRGVWADIHAAEPGICLHCCVQVWRERGRLGRGGRS